MRKLPILGLVTAAILAVPAASSAQIASRVQRDRDRYERNDRYERDRRDDRYDRGRKGKAKGGPAFCRDGRGHPVKGRRWCVDKGFGLGPVTARRVHRWDRVRWSDVYFYDRYRPARRPVRSNRGDWLRDVLGDAIYIRIGNHSRSLGWTSALRGEWFDDDDGRVLNVFAGDEPVALLLDRNRDGRVDDVRVIGRR